MSFVLDCSVAVAWCFADEASSAADALLGRLRDQGAVVPQLWHLEVGNVLTLAERRGRLTASNLLLGIELLLMLPIVTDHQTPAQAVRSVLALAREHRLTTYDAAYLELAIRRGLPPATRDTDLQRAARRIGTSLLAA